MIMKMSFKRAGEILKISKLKFLSGLILSIASVPSLGSVDVWTSQTSIQSLPTGSFSALENSGLTPRTKSLLIQTCQKKISEQNSFSVGDHTGSVYHVSQLSASQESTRHCIGRVGESACIKESLRAAINDCIALRLAEAELDRAL